MDKDMGRKRRGRKKGGEIVRLVVVVQLLCVLGGVNAVRGEPGVIRLVAFTVLVDACGSNVDTSAGTGETLVNIADKDQLRRWYDQRLTGGDSTGVLPKNMVIIKPITLGPPDGWTDISPAEIRMPEGPIEVLAPENLVQAGVIIDNPNLFITGTKNMISVEGEGYLTLKRGQIQRDASDEPAIILRNQETLVWEEGKDFKGLKKTDIRNECIDPPKSVPLDESRTGPEYGGIQPQLAEAVLLNIGADGGGSARLELKSLPSDINVLYVLRSESGHSWKKEENKVTTVSSQSGQETVEYESFLKETGNTLNIGIVADGYLIYRFQSGESSLYVKVGIERPGGSYETDKVRIAISEIVGQGFTLSYGGGSYSCGGGYTGGYGSGFGEYGGGSIPGGGSSIQPGTRGESDVPEGPVRGRGGRRRDSYTPYSVPGYKDGGTAAGRIIEEMIQEATSSEARGPGRKDEDSDSQVQPTAGWEDTDTAGQTEEGDEIMGTEPNPSQGEGQEGGDSGISGLKWYAGAVLCAVMLGCGVACLRRRKRK